MTARTPVAIRLDADGVPVSEYRPIDGREVGSQRSVVAVAEKGLDYWNQAHPEEPPVLCSYSWEPGRDLRTAGEPGSDVDNRDGLLACADWLVGAVGWSGDAALWTYDYASYRGTRPGWRSGHAQGQAIRLLLRASEVSGRSHYRELADRAVLAYGIPVEERGFTRVLSSRRWWYSKFADTASTESYVLNGMLFALLGLHDHLRRTDDPGTRTRLRRGLAAVVHLLPRFDDDGWSSYDLTGRPASKHYHGIQCQQLGELYGNRPPFRVRRVLRRWQRADVAGALGGHYERRAKRPAGSASPS